MKDIMQMAVFNNLFNKKLEEAVVRSHEPLTSKKEIRAYVLQKRRELQMEEKKRMDEALLERLRPFFPPAGTAVYAYTSVRGEAGTERLIDELLKHGCRVALPRVFGREMRFFYISDRNRLVTGAFGIPEPVDGCPEADAPDALVITPGVGFSIDGSRVGYGAGYYDRFFATEPDHRSVGICYDFQLFQAFETEKHDKKMAYIVTPEQVIEILPLDT